MCCVSKPTVPQGSPSKAPTTRAAQRPPSPPPPSMQRRLQYFSRVFTSTRYAFLEASKCVGEQPGGEGGGGGGGSYQAGVMQAGRQTGGLGNVHQHDLQMQSRSPLRFLPPAAVKEAISAISIYLFFMVLVILGFAGGSPPSPAPHPVPFIVFLCALKRDREGGARGWEGWAPMGHG